MGIFAEFTNAAVGLVKLGPSLDRKQRQEIRDAVGELADELTRALVLAEAYLAGAKNSRDSADLAIYLRDAPNKLMQSFSEYKICGGLYALEDRFDRVFDPTRLSVAAGSLGEFRALIQSLSFGERMVIDDLDGLMAKLRGLADELDATAPGEHDAVRAKIMATMTVEMTRLEDQKKLIKKSMREAFSKM